MYTSLKQPWLMLLMIFIMSWAGFANAYTVQIHQQSKLVVSSSESAMQHHQASMHHALTVPNASAQQHMPDQLSQSQADCHLAHQASEVHQSKQVHQGKHADHNANSAVKEGCHQNLHGAAHDAQQADLALAHHAVSEKASQSKTSQSNTSQLSAAHQSDCQDCHTFHCQMASAALIPTVPELAAYIDEFNRKAVLTAYDSQHLVGHWQKILRPPKA